MGAARARKTKRDYPRSARLGELIREIVADELTRVDDERLELVAVTGVEVDNELNRAVVFFDGLEGPDGDDDITAALEELRVALKGAVARQARVRRIPELVFRPDHGIRAGERIDEILRDLDLGGEAAGADPGPPSVGDPPTSP